ncbi:uncharacterized protein LOC130657869 [Hydractinia symbiolongicarpus]|uniref:uncharacterized protein LOC130657869 n=1 Tax=Hydractinia symbiolongicarpus TaxID=13093 RepID=UPI00254F3001|nr:uncharacterized protein LOC130657869 [Hydractinia symbiolongicarpus]
MDCSPEYVDDIERKQLPVDTAGEEQLIRRKKRRARHMTMKYDDTSKMLADIEAAKELSEGQRMDKVEHPVKGREREGGIKANPAEEEQHYGKSKVMEGDKQVKVKSCLKKKTEGDQLKGKQTLNVNGNVDNSKARKVFFSEEVTYYEDFASIKTKKKRKFHNLRNATIIIERKKTVLVKAMRKLVEKHKATKLKLLEEKKAVILKAAEMESLNLVLSGKEVELRKKEKEIACMKANASDIKTTVSESLQKSVTKLDTVEENIRADIRKIERKLAQRWRFVGKKKLLAEKQKLTVMLDTICATSQTLQKDAILLDTFKF